MILKKIVINLKKNKVKNITFKNVYTIINASNKYIKPLNAGTSRNMQRRNIA